tara:strand:- start:200 stop:1018 length:819 start_codon:yes stop_codon:yes gene_type:complete
MKNGKNLIENKKMKMYFYLPLLLCFLLVSCENDEKRLRSELVTLRAEFKNKDLANDSLVRVIKELSSKKIELEELLTSDPINFSQEIDYTDKNILKVIKQFGPVKFIKENGLWYILSVDLEKDKFNLLKIPVMKIYGNNLDFTELRKEYLQNQRYIIERSNSLSLNNIVDVDYSFKFKKDISVDNMDLEITHSNITVRGNIINLTSKRINGVKLEVSIYSSPIDGELLETKEVTINKIINSSELKTIDYSYSTSVTNGLGFFGYNIEYISYF